MHPLGLFQVVIIASHFGVALCLISCDFEDDLCGWSDVSNSSYTWKIHSGPTPDFTSGPQSDHTFMERYGHYVYSNGRKARRSSVASLESSTISLSKNVILTFWYHMHGNGIGSLSLVRIDHNTSRILWLKGGRHTNSWLQASVTLEPGTFELLLESTVKHSFGNDIAVDDIQLLSEPQVIRIKPTFTTRTTSAGGSQCDVIKPGVALQGSCDFEKGNCGYSSTSKLKWLRTNKKKGFLFHIPGDHGTGSGYYMYLALGLFSSNNNDEMATLISPSLSTNTGACLSFAYIVVTSHVLTIHVYAETSKRRQLLASISKRNMEAWAVKNISLCATTNTKITFDSMVEGYTSHVGLDDITITSGLCGVNYNFSTNRPNVTSSPTVSVYSIQPSSDLTSVSSIQPVPQTVSSQPIHSQPIPSQPISSQPILYSISSQPASSHLSSQPISQSKLSQPTSCLASSQYVTLQTTSSQPTSSQPTSSQAALLQPTPSYSLSPQSKSSQLVPYSSAQPVSLQPALSHSSSQLISSYSTSSQPTVSYLSSQPVSSQPVPSYSTSSQHALAYSSSQPVSSYSTSSQPTVSYLSSQPASSYSISSQPVLSYSSSKPVSSTSSQTALSYSLSQQMSLYSTSSPALSYSSSQPVSSKPASSYSTSSQPTLAYSASQPVSSYSTSPQTALSYLSSQPVSSQLVSSYSTSSQPALSYLSSQPVSSYSTSSQSVLSYSSSQPVSSQQVSSYSTSSPASSYSTSPQTALSYSSSQPVSSQPVSLYSTSSQPALSYSSSQPVSLQPASSYFTSSQPETTTPYTEVSKQNGLSRQSVIVITAAVVVVVVVSAVAMLYFGYTRRKSHGSEMTVLPEKVTIEMLSPVYVETTYM